MGIIVGILILCLLLAVLGFAVKGLFWLVIIAVILIVVTGGVGFRNR